MIQFQGLSQQSDYFVALKQKRKAFWSGPRLQGPGGVDVTTKKLSPEVNRSFQFLLCSMLANLSSLTSNLALYSLRDEWSELDKFPFQIYRLTFVFGLLSESVGKTLSIV